MMECTRVVWILWIVVMDRTWFVCSGAGGGASGELSRVLSEFWAWRLQQVPEFATSVGVHDHDDRLELFNMQAYDHRKATCESFLARLSAVERGRLTERERRDHRVLTDDLQTYVDGYTWRTFGSLNPINYLEGLHRDFSYWLDAMDFSTEQGFNNYIVRLRALATQIYEQINLMTDAIAYGVTNHEISLLGVTDEIAVMVASPHQSPFFKPFNDSLRFTSMSPNKQEKIWRQGEIAVIDQVIPAYRRLLTFLNQEYLPAARPGIGLSSLPHGAEYYAARLRWHLSLAVLPEPASLHRLGQMTVDSLLAQMEQIKQSSGYEGTLTEFLKYAHGASKFFYRTEHELLQEYRNIIRRIQRRLPRYFKYTHVQDFSVQRMPFDGPAAIMMPGSEDAMMKGVFFVNVHNPLKCPKWKLMALTLHETLPGRLLQVEYERNQSLPMFRKFREFRKSYAAPFQFPFHSAYIEGWALYAESLGRDMHLLKDEFSDFGQLFSELYRACEMVVDTGIHAFGWSRDEAIAYLVKHTGVSSAQAGEGVARIITVPGQAVAPEYGHLMLKLLKDRAQEKFGALFDIREFHHQVLSLGPVPLYSLEQHINLWIADHAPHVAAQSAAATPRAMLGTGWGWVLMCVVTTMVGHVR